MPKYAAEDLKFSLKSRAKVSRKIVLKYLGKVLDFSRDYCRGLKLGFTDQFKGAENVLI